MKNQRGFTLIELAIVLVIVTILIGGLAMPLSAQIQARRIAETNRTLEEAREAIIGYAMSHRTKPNTCTCSYDNDGDLDTGSSSTCTFSTADKVCPSTGIPNQSSTETYIRHYLPCPDKLDDGNPATTNDGDGVEELRDMGRCPPQTEGYLPWVTLGVGSQDAWGNRLLYSVTRDFSNSITGFPTTGGGDFQICDASTNTNASDCGALGNIAGDIPAVLVSYGPNGWGALNVNGKKLADPSSNDEKENANTVIDDKEFVSRFPSRAGDAAGEFDDLVKWISADQLRGRICPAGGCP